MDGRKSIVVVGASSGLGAALTQALAKDGHDLFVCARRVDRLAKVVHGYESAFAAGCDVGREAEVERFFRQVGERTNTIDVLLYCAGVLGPVGPFHELDGEAWFAAIRTNLLGAFLAAKHVVPLMKSERRPRILMLSGGGAFDPMPRVSAYGVSKAAIVRLVETLAVELAPLNIAVNAVAPGFVATEIHEATLAAGPERAGEQYDKTVKLLAEWDNTIDVPIDCVRYMISDASAKLNGKTISARYDPWGEPEFDRHIDAVMSSPLYTTQRTIPTYMNGTALAQLMARAAENKRRRLARRLADDGTHCRELRRPGAI